jgi:hypothetical protein
MKIQKIYCLIKNRKCHFKFTYKSLSIKPGGLNLSRHGFNRDSGSQHWQRVGIDGQE